MSEAQDRIKFHPGFYGAAELEFRLETTKLEFHTEYNLSKEPLRADLLIIRKDDDFPIQNETGRIFKQYNIIEYKSPDDGLTIDDLFKTTGYACLYKSLGKTVNQIPEEQITVSLFRDTYPQELFKALEQSGRVIEEKYPGIYYVKGKLQFDTQIVVMSQLDKEKHSAFRVLSKNAKEEDVRRFLKESAAFVEQGDRANADAVFEVSISANEALYEKIRSDDFMCKAMENLMQDVIEQRVNERANEIANKIANERANEIANKIANERANEIANKIANERANEIVNERMNEIANEIARKISASYAKFGTLSMEDVSSALGLSMEELTALQEN